MKKRIILLAAIFAILVLLGTVSSLKLPRGDPGGSSETPPVSEPGTYPVQRITVYPNEIFF